MMDRTRIPLSSRKQPLNPRVPHSVSVTRSNNNIVHPPARRIVRRSNSCSDLNFGATPVSRLNAQSTINLTTINKRPAFAKPNLKTVPSVKLGSKRVAVDPPAQAPTNTKVAKIPPYDYKARFNALLEKHKILQQTLLDKDAALSSTTDQLGDALNEFALLKKKSANLEDDLNRAIQAGAVNEARIRELENTQSLLRQDLLKLQDTNYAQQQLLELYEGRIQEHEHVRRIMHNQIQDLKGTIRVFCRVRPALFSEDSKQLCNIGFIDEDMLEIKKTNELNGSRINDACLQFVFDKVFQPEASQVDVFHELSQLIQSAMDGYHVCVFAYGQTGSGKTYTMQGGDGSSPGMIPQTVDFIFNLIAKYEKIGWRYTVEASFLEIYNESIRDLLKLQSKEHLDICFNEGKGITVRNLTINPVHSPQELHTLISRAIQNRAVASTNYNEHSSRSHVVTKISLTGVHLNTVHNGSLSLVDLAGSESAKTSERITETKNINKSLTALGSVMSALQNKENHVPYRNSKLTYLLQSSLGGNSKTLMFVNIAPFQECYGESVNALRFASKVKEVKLMSKKNKTVIRN
ncbi:hypothetical protein PPYR_06731 [Photinus pyralis]|uniref:Kinesin-like protein n=2 Tax=Photinus pyralis TaxID=7054 RepID=A0A5N4ANH0_PHOPY|nr:protein claret segregational-like [Photinus pyralis]KAB0798851.1 hypothetical protein PPYR_06731 [Photinus pyralis]